MRWLWSFACGLVFSAGICVSGMVRPSKVLAFLDVTGDWDPSLMFVMGSAIVVYAIAWRLARARTTPWLGGDFPAPAPKTLDARLIGGAALFGVGWGLSGLCPGPMIISTVTMRYSLVALAGTIVGMYAYMLVDPKYGRVDEASAAPPPPGPADSAGAPGA